jgi:hypothetical protein
MLNIIGAENSIQKSNIVEKAFFILITCIDSVICTFARAKVAVFVIHDGFRAIFAAISVLLDETSERENKSSQKTTFCLPGCHRLSIKNISEFRRAKNHVRGNI